MNVKSLFSKPEKFTSYELESPAARAARKWDERTLQAERSGEQVFSVTILEEHARNSVRPRCLQRKFNNVVWIFDERRGEEVADNVEDGKGDGKIRSSNGADKYLDDTANGERTLVTNSLDRRNFYNQQRREEKSGCT